MHIVISTHVHSVAGNFVTFTVQLYHLFFDLLLVGKLDSVASETLAKVEEKFPCIRKTPSEVSKTIRQFETLLLLTSGVHVFQ